MNLSDFCARPWILSETYPCLVFAQDFEAFCFDAGNKIVAQKIVEDHNNQLESNQAALSLLIKALSTINENKGEKYKEVEDIEILEAFLKTELSAYLAAIKKCSF